MIGFTTTRVRIYQVSVLERNEIAFRVEVMCRKTFLALAPLDLTLSFGGSGPGWEVHAEEFGVPVAISPVDCKLRQVFDVQN